MAFLGDSELAVTKSVPELDCSIARSGDDLSVVSGEGNGQNIVGVANKASGGGTGGKLPKAESLVPRGRESIGTVGGDNLKSVSAFISIAETHWSSRRTYAVRHNVRVTVERSLWVAVGALIAGQVPNNQRLIARTGQEHVRVFERGREGGDPSRVALKGALENELFGHLAGSFGRCSIDLRRRVCTKYQEIFFVGGLAKRHPNSASANFHKGLWDAKGATL